MMSCCYQHKEKCQLSNPCIRLCPKLLSETDCWISSSYFFICFWFIHSRTCRLALRIAGLSKIREGLRLLCAAGQSSFHHFCIKHHFWRELFCIHLLYQLKPISYLVLWRNFMFSVGLDYGMDIIWLNFGLCNWEVTLQRELFLKFDMSFNIEPKKKP